jgi:hypothetical protein
VRHCSGYALVCRLPFPVAPDDASYTGLNRITGRFPGRSRSTKGWTYGDDSTLLGGVKDRVGSVKGLDDVTTGGLGTDSIAGDA